VLWFHPLAWWVARKTEELSELACDASVLQRANDPAAYSRILLEFANEITRAGHRAALPGLAIASKSGMSRRIDSIFEISAGGLRKLSHPGAFLALLGAPVVCLAATVVLTPRTQQSPHLAAAPTQPPAVPIHTAQETPVTQRVETGARPGPQAPRVLQAQAQQTQAQQSRAQQSRAQPNMPPPTDPSPQAAVAKFEVASIKACAPDEAGGRGGRGGRGGGIATGSPGLLTARCSPVRALIQQAYAIYAGGHVNPDFQFITIEGGPSWINSDRYTIDAKGDESAGIETMRGPMLEALLEERFQLKIHRETRDVPVYLLTVAKGGSKLKISEGSCTPFDPSKPAPPPIPGEKPICGGDMFIRRNGNAWVSTLSHADLGQIARNLANTLGRRVIDRTGIQGWFDVRLEFAPDDSIALFAGRGGRGIAPDPTSNPVSPSDPTAPSIFTAVQETLGLKLEPAKGPGEFIVIDRVERPSEN
jgi:uncharacterized protein (TIGR03435 family)